jgi:integrase
VPRVRSGRKQTKYEKRILPDERFLSLLERLPEPVGAIVETAVSTGMRISWILGLRWRSVDLGRGLVHVEERYYRGELAAPNTERSLRLQHISITYRHHSLKTKDLRPLYLDAEWTPNAIWGGLDSIPTPQSWLVSHVLRARARLSSLSEDRWRRRRQTFFP